MLKIKPHAENTVSVNFQVPDDYGVREAFDRASDSYDGASALELEVGSRLLERVAFQRLDPRRVVDLGSATGHCAAILKRRFRKSEVIGLDSSLAMSRRFRRKSSFMHPMRSVCADISQLPFADRSADLLFSNLAMQWVEDFHLVMAGFRRVLRPDGLLLFSSLGPDSLKELRGAVGETLGSASTRQFTDMHIIGDALLAAGFSEPVVDSEIITTQYEDFDVLMSELEATGAGTHFSCWDEMKSAKTELAQAYETYRFDGRYPVSWEIVYGAAFGPEEGQPIKTGEGDIAAFSVEHLRASNKHRRG